MARFFIRVYNSDSNEPECDEQVLTEKEANVVLMSEGPSKLRELVPIVTDVRQVKQEVIL